MQVCNTFHKDAVTILCDGCEGESNSPTNEIKRLQMKQFHECIAICFCQTCVQVKCIWSACTKSMEQVIYGSNDPTFQKWFETLFFSRHVLHQLMEYRSYFPGTAWRRLVIRYNDTTVMSVLNMFFEYPLFSLFLQVLPAVCESGCALWTGASHWGHYRQWYQTKWPSLHMNLFLCRSLHVFFTSYSIRIEKLLSSHHSSFVSKGCLDLAFRKTISLVYLAPQRPYRAPQTVTSRAAKGTRNRSCGGSQASKPSYIFMLDLCDA
jgi:hypothetical protein